MDIGELSSVSMLRRPELPFRRSAVEKVIAPEELGAWGIVAGLLIKLVVKADTEAEVVGVIAVAAAIEVLSVKQVEEETDGRRWPRTRLSEYLHREHATRENQGRRTNACRQAAITSFAISSSAEGHSALHSFDVWRSDGHVDIYSQ